MTVSSMPAEVLLWKYKSLKRDLQTKPAHVFPRVAILGGSTTSEVKDLLEWLLLDEGIRRV